MTLRSVEAFILAGGKSSRMGSPKGLLEVDGRPIVARVIDVLRPLFQSVTMVSNDHPSVSHLGLPLIADRYPDRGPIGGLDAALNAARSHTVFIASWDLPFLSSNIVQMLFLRHGAGPVTIAATRTGLHPLVGFYNTSILSAVERRLQSDQLSMQMLAHDLNARMLDVSDVNPHYSNVELFNVNTPEDLSRARRIVIQMRTSGVGLASVA